MTTKELGKKLLKTMDTTAPSSKSKDECDKSISELKKFKKPQAYLSQFNTCLEAASTMHNFNTGMLKIDYSQHTLYERNSRIDYTFANPKNDKVFLFPLFMVISYVCEIGLKVFLCERDDKQYRTHDFSKLFSAIDDSYREDITNEFNKTWEEFCKLNKMDVVKYSCEAFTEILKEIESPFASCRYLDAHGLVAWSMTYNLIVNFLMNFGMAIRGVANNFVHRK